MAEGSGEHRAGARCLEPETIAALVEGRLLQSECAAARSHLAMCHDCTELAGELVLAMEHLAAHPAAPQQRAFESWRKPVPWLIAASVLIAAAATVLALRLQPGWLSSGRGAGDPTLGALVAAVGAERSIEGRLTGGFAYGTLRTPERSGVPADNLRLLAAAGTIQEAAERNPTQANLHAWGVAQLAAGLIDAGLETLESAAVQGSMTARLAADLGAGRLAAATTSDRPDLLPRALEALEEATDLDPDTKEAWFTKALVLERLRLPVQAAAAWHRYLALDPSSEWSVEARLRLAALDRQAQAPGWSRFDEAIAGGTIDDEALQHAAGAFPCEVREAVLRHVLPSWARTHLAGQSDLGTLVFARRAVRLLETPAGGERLLTHVLAQIDAAGPAQRAALARGILDLGAGLVAQDEERTTDARERLQSAAIALRASGSVLEAVASVALARIAVRGSRHEDTVRLASAAIRRARSVPSAALEARAQNILGLAAFTTGRWDDALHAYDESIRASGRSGETTLAGSVHVNLSILHRFLGSRVTTWQHRSAAAAALPSHRPLQRHVYLTTGAVTASLESLPRTALLFQHEVVGHAIAQLGPGPITESHLTRSRMLSRIGRTADAQADLRAADAAALRVSAGDMRTRLARARALASAEVHLRIDPSRAADDAAIAAELIDASGEPMRSAEARLLQSRALAALGRIDAAQAAALRGIDDFERALRSIDARDPTRLSAAESVWALYSGASRLHVLRDRPSYDDGFALIERGRARMLVDQGALTPMSLLEVRASLRAGEAVLMFDQAADDLVVWWISSHAVRIARAGISARAAETLVARHRRAVTRGMRRDPAAAELFELALGPFREWFGKTSALAVIPDAAWTHVAWPVLWDPQTGSELVERTAVTMAPSASVAVRDREATAGPRRRALVVAAPRVDGRRELPAARVEAGEIAALYAESRLIQGAAATPESVLAQARQADIVHLSGHAVDVPSSPQMSHLVLMGPDGGAKLFVSDIAQVDLSGTQLVVLAACATAGRAAIRGEGTVGVAWGFLTAGTHRVVATLQEIEDAPARIFFTRMHRRIAAGASPPLALHEVQRELAAAGESPRLWAAIVAIGAM